MPVDSISASAFYEAVVLGKRWSGDEAAAVGIVSKSVPGDQLLEVALKEAAQQAKLGEPRAAPHSQLIRVIYISCMYFGCSMQVQIIVS
jgi:enoyl-CoA hydratase/carnithine racemase